VHWPMILSLRTAPGPTTRASGLRQRSAGAALKRNLKKAKKGWGPLAEAPPGATGSASEELCAAFPQRRRLLANCAGGSQRPLQRLLAGPGLVELAGLAELAE
jgi:hypothetical protein